MSPDALVEIHGSKTCASSSWLPSVNESFSMYIMADHSEYEMLGTTSDLELRVFKNSRILAYKDIEYLLGKS